MKSRSCYAALFFSFALTIAGVTEVKDLAREISAVANQDFSWAHGTSGLSFSAMHLDHRNVYVLQIDGRPFLRLTTDGARPDSDSTPLRHLASLRSAATDVMASVDRTGYSPTENTSPFSPEDIRLASIFRPCRTNRTHKNGLERLYIASPSE